MNIFAMKQARGIWLNQILDDEIRNICQQNDIKIPICHGKGKSPWGNWQWHLKHRLTDQSLDLFLKLFPRYQGQKLETYCEDFNLSILPLNLLLGSDVLSKFLPEIGFVAKEDPYGCVREESTIYQENMRGKIYLGSRKPKYKTILMILSSIADRVNCPIGCAHCYRPARFKNRKWELIKDDGIREPLMFLPPTNHAAELVKRWNNDPLLSDAYDLILSGGEPLMLSNTTIKEMLKELGKAKYLKTLRICTGTVFLGLPFRIDDELIQIFKDFEKKTGVIVDFNVHLSHPANFSPEAIMAARKIREAGFDILTQVPLEEGVNFWRNDIPRTIEILRRVARLTQFVA